MGGLDTWLLAAIALCQAATAYQGFHVSTRSVGARLFFGGITIVTVGLLIWSGTRPNPVEEGVSRIETVSTSNSVLLKQQTDMIDSQGKLLGSYKAQLNEQEKQLKLIAGAANVNPNQAAPELASAVVKRLSELDKRVQKVEYPPRDNNKLYDGARVVADIAMDTQRVTDTVLIRNLTSSSPFDPSKTYLLQAYSVKCDSGQPVGSVTMGGLQHFEYANVRCTVLGKAPG